MTIDERLIRLTERREALIQRIEVMQRDWQEGWSEITAARQAAAKIRTLAHIAEIPEGRHFHLEGEQA